MKDRKIQIIDSTLRDGNHTVNNNFNLDDIKTIVGKLDKLGADFIEVGYGFGSGYFQKEGYATDHEILETALKESKKQQNCYFSFP